MYNYELEDNVRQLITLLAGIIEIRDQYNPLEGGEFICELFEIRPYYWGDDEEQGEKPNFVYHSEDGDFWAVWYKHIGRGARQNKSLSHRQLLDMVNKCINYVT